MPPPEEEAIEEWNLLQGARWLGVAPWELLERSALWLNKAVFYGNIEADVQEMRIKNANNGS
jgi:hypothetical protein